MEGYKHSDLVIDDGAVDSLIKKLEKLEGTYKQTFEAMQKQALQVKANTEKLTTSTSEQRDAIGESAKEAEKLRKAHENLARSQSDNAEELARLKKAQAEQNKLTKLQVQLADAAEGSYEQLSAQYGLNKTELNKMSKAQRENTKAGQDLEVQTKAIYEEMNRLQKNTGITSLKTGDYEEQVKKALAASKNQEEQLAALSIQYNKNVEALTKLEKKKKGTTQEAKELKQETEKMRVVMLDLKKTTGDVNTEITDLDKSLEDAKKKMEAGEAATGALSGAIGSMVPGFGAASEGAKSLGKQFLALMANPIVLLISAVVAGITLMYKAFTRMSSGAEKLEMGMAAIGVVFDTVLGRIGRLITGEISLKQALTGVSAEIEEGIALSNKLIIARRALAQQTADSELEEAKLNLQMAKARGIRDRDNFSMSIRRKEGLKFAKLQQEQSEVIIAQAKKEEKAARLAFAKTKPLSEARRDAQVELTKAIVNTTRAQAEAEDMRQEALTQIETVERDIFEQRLDLLLDITDRQKTINEQRIKEDNLGIEQQRELANENVSIIEDAFQKQIKTFEDFQDVVIDQDKLLNSSGAEVEAYADSLGFGEIPVNRLREAIIEKNQADRDNLVTMREIDEKEKQLAKDREQRAKDLKASALTRGKDAIAQEYELDLSRIKLLKKTEDEKTKLVLEAEKKRIKAILRLNEIFGKELSKKQIETLNNQIKAIDNEIAAVGANVGEGDIYDMFGITLNDDKKQAISDGVGSVVNSIQQIGAARLEIANQRAAQSQTELDNAFTYFEEQKALREAGEKSNFEFARRELERTRATNKKALKEQERAQKAQNRLDTISQTVSLITASANIFKSFTKAFPLIGSVIAIPVIGAMFAAFAAQKIKAAKLARTQKLGKGGSFMVGGGSHASGKDTSLGVHEGREIKVEKGEQTGVFSRKAVARYGRGAIDNLINDVNSGTYKEIYNKTRNGLPDIVLASNNNDKQFAALLEENKLLRKEIKTSITSRPEIHQSWDHNGYRENLRQGNLTYLDIQKENSHG